MFSCEFHEHYDCKNNGSITYVLQTSSDIDFSVKQLESLVIASEAMFDNLLRFVRL